MVGVFVADPDVGGAVEYPEYLRGRGFDEQGPALVEGFTEKPGVA